MSEFENAKDKVMMGAERRSLVMTEEERRLTAYHEGGHALVTVHCPASDPIHKATIIPRGRALGMVMRLPETDRLSVSREKLMADITVAMGGRIAEELVFGADKVTSGASSDIQMATHLARNMVTQYGMSEKLGPLTYAENEQEIFLGHSVTQTKTVSEATAEVIDAEVRHIVESRLRAGARHPRGQHRGAARSGQGADRIRDADRCGDHRLARGRGGRAPRRGGIAGRCRQAFVGAVERR